MYIYIIFSIYIYVYIHICVCTTNANYMPTYLANLANSGTTLHLAFEKLGTRPLAKCWLSEWPQSASAFCKRDMEISWGVPQ